MGWHNPDIPWSELERMGHRLLRQRRITGWRTNVRVSTRAGDGYYADVYEHWLAEAE
jgi:hypothetical protein